ncbi:MAG: hypothetical protein P4L53_09465 [Candidatus Obscuribacterales bacterium]|nr:hypothetical protein [Candidatus Obscuribacterales bacterium]
MKHQSTGTSHELQESREAQTRRRYRRYGGGLLSRLALGVQADLSLIRSSAPTPYIKPNWSFKA